MVFPRSVNPEVYQQYGAHWFPEDFGRGICQTRNERLNGDTKATKRAILEPGAGLELNSMPGGGAGSTSIRTFRTASAEPSRESY